jgi:hypothetical protein
MSRLIRKASWWPWLGLGLVLAAVLGVLIWPGARAQEGEPQTQPVATFSTSDYTVGEADGTVTVTVTLSQSSSQTVTVDYATSDGTATTWPDDADYVAANGTLTFAPGETSKSIVITIIDDTCCEDNETFGVTLFNPVGATLGSPSTSTVTILDDDVCP